VDVSRFNIKIIDVLPPYVSIFVIKNCAIQKPLCMSFFIKRKYPVLEFVRKKMGPDPGSQKLLDSGILASR
jgi:hypothetical protein